MAFVIGFLAAVAGLLSYRFLEAWTSRNWLPALLRATGWGTLSVLLLNAACPAVRASARPLVLLDASLSMQAAGGRWAEALALARRSGEVRFVGALPGDTLPTAGRSRMAAALISAAASARRIVVVSDGEIEDADELADSAGGAEVHVLPRRVEPDIAVSRVEGTTRLTPSDSLRLELELVSFGAIVPGRRVELEAREGSRVWLHGTATLDAAGRASAVLQGPLPAVPPGAHVLTVAIRAAADSEPRDDARLVVVTIVPTPGVVLLASPPTWESRFLLETLRAVTALPARGYLETERGVWRRAEDLHPISQSEVADAARRADLLVTLGAVSEVARGSRARGRWSWPGAARVGLTGDWYLSAPAASPVSGAFTGLALDSFPPGTAITEITPPPNAWTGLTAQASRRGTVRPVLIGRDSARVRQVLTGIDGLWRWAFRGGSSEQGYRSLVAAAVSWLLGGSDSLSGKARLQRDVVQRGRPAVFEWNGGGRPEPLALEWSGDSGVRRDTLAFDGAGRAAVMLPPGIWRYRLNEGGSGTLAVEPYSDEWLPGRVSLHDRAGGAPLASDRRLLRNAVWLFGLAVVAFAGEWFARRRLGLR